MVNEIAVITILPEEEQDFIETYRKVAPVIRRQPGYYSDKLMKVAENDNEYILSIIWDSVESHINFTKTEDFKLVADPWGPFQKKVTVRHGQTVVSSGQPAG